MQYDKTKDFNENDNKLNHKLLLVHELYEQGTLPSLIAAYQIIKNEKEHSEEKAVRGWKGSIIVRLYEKLQSPNSDSEFKKLKEELAKSMPKPTSRL